MENELAAEEAVAKGEAEEGFKAKEVLKFPFFWTLLLGAGLLNTITTMSQLFATYVQFLGHEGWYGAEPSSRYCSCPVRWKRLLQQARAAARS